VKIGKAVLKAVRDDRVVVLLFKFLVEFQII